MQPNNIVLDPFAGSGSTCVAAALSWRHHIGIELLLNITPLINNVLQHYVIATLLKTNIQKVIKMNYSDHEIL